MKILRLIIILTLFCCEAKSQSRLDLIGGKADLAVSRYTKRIDGVRVASSKVILESNLELDIFTSDDSIVRDTVDLTTLPNGMNQYLIVFYMTKPVLSIPITITAEGYEDYDLGVCEFTPKQTNKYYVFDPTVEKKINKVMSIRKEDQIIQAGKKLLQAGDYDGAIAQFDKALVENVICDSAYYYKGKALIAQERYGEAQTAYMMALNINEEFDDIYNDLRKLLLDDVLYFSKNNIGYAYYKRVNPTLEGSDRVLLGVMSGDYNRAILCYNRALREDSDDVFAYYMLTYTYVQKRMLDESVQAYQNYIDRTDVNTSKLLKMIAACMPKDERRTLFLDTYVEQYKEAIAKYPNRYDFKAYLAGLYSEQRKLSKDAASKTVSYKESIALYLELLDKAQRDASSSGISEYCRLLSFYYDVLGESELSEKYGQLHSAAQIVADKEHFEELVAQYVSEDPSLEGNWQELGKKNVTDKKYSRICFERAIESGEYDAEVCNNLAAIYTQYSEHAKAIDCYKRMYDLGVELEPAKLKKLVNSRSDDSLMIEFLEYAQSKYPQFFFYPFYLGRIYDSIKGVESSNKALAYYNKAIEIGADDVDLKGYVYSTYRYLGYLYRDLKNDKMADKSFKNAEKYK